MDMMTKRDPDMTEQLRQAIRDSELRPAEIAREAGIGYASMYDFLNGKKGLSLTVAARIAKVLNLELRPVKRRRKGR